MPSIESGKLYVKKVNTGEMFRFDAAAAEIALFSDPYEADFDYEVEMYRIEQGDYLWYEVDEETRMVDLLYTREGEHASEWARLDEHPLYDKLQERIALLDMLPSYHVSHSRHLKVRANKARLDGTSRAMYGLGAKLDFGGMNPTWFVIIPEEQKCK